MKAHSVVMGIDAMDRVRRSNVAAFSVANNHVYDAGVDAFDRMIERLNSLEDIQFYGLKDRPFAKLNCNGLRIAVIGCLEPCR
ncbi:MAG TPA: CapA family protein, partial [Pirellulaceae bacterium]|nr:CapA family protein [Pirellulaceae bacterium]